MWPIVLCLGVVAAIEGYPRESIMFGGRSTVSWELVGTTHVRFAFTSSQTVGWTALGFSTGGMRGDAIIMEAAGLAINAYNVRGTVQPEKKTTPYFTNASVTLVGNTMIGRFTRTLAAPTGSVAINPNSVLFMYGDSPFEWPSQHSVRTTETLDLIGTPAPTAPTNQQPTNSPAPTMAAQSTLDNYAHSFTAFQGKVKVAWQIVSGNRVKFGIESLGAQWVSIGFQDPSVSQKMNGDAVVIETNVITATTVKYGVTPTTLAGSYFTLGSGARTSNLLYGTFIRSFRAPLPGTVNFTNINHVRLMIAYSDYAYPAQHQGRIEIPVNLEVGIIGSIEPTPVSAPGGSNSSGTPNLSSATVISFFEAAVLCVVLGLLF